MMGISRTKGSFSGKSSRKKCNAKGANVDECGAGKVERNFCIQLEFPVINPMRSLFADRIGGVYFDEDAGYKMSKIKDMKRKAQMHCPGRYFLDMGIGEPDDMPPEFVIDELHEQATWPTNMKYADNGGMDFRLAARRYMGDVFGVLVDERYELVHCIGAKSALSLLPLCIVNPGDVVLTTTPGYPIFGTHAKYLGGEEYQIPLRRENNFLPDLTTIPTDVAKKAKAFLVNYPNNPTSAVATVKFFNELIEFAKSYGILVINDAAYASLVVRDKPLSILRIAGAKNTAVEIHSMSKAYNMTGWRLGWICGNHDIISAFSVVKDNSDSGQFLAIQKAAALALHDTKFPRKMAKKYHRRKMAVGKILSEKGFDVFLSNCGFFLYVKKPNAVRYAQQLIEFSTAKDFQQWLLNCAGIISVPWDCHEPGLRFSMTFPCYTERSFFEELRSRFAMWSVEY